MKFSLRIDFNPSKFAKPSTENFICIKLKRALPHSYILYKITMIPVSQIVYLH